jgi:hypothetical protein
MCLVPDTRTSRSEDPEDKCIQIFSSPSTEDKFFKVVRKNLKSSRVAPRVGLATQSNRTTLIVSCQLYTSVFDITI